MNGIPIQYLNGIDDVTASNLLDVVYGHDLIEGIGLGSAAEGDAAMLNYLRKTRDLIIQAPGTVSTVMPAEDALKMFNYAIEYWNTPKRQEALDNLIKLEEKLMAEGKILMNGLDEDDSMGYLGSKKKSGFWSKVKDAGKKVGNAAKAAAKFVVRYNPATITVRAGVLAALKINMNKMSAKLGPAYLTQSQAQKEGVSPENHKKAVEALKKVENMFVNVLQGRSENLKKAILSGKRREWRGKTIENEKELTSVIAKNIHEAKDVMDGLGAEPVTTAATVAAATPFIVKIWNWTKGLFVSSDGKPNESAKLLTQSAANAVAKKQQEKNEASQTSESYSSEEIDEINPKSTTMENTTLKKLTNPKTLAIVGGAVLIGVIGYNLMKKSKPERAETYRTVGPGLSGVSKRKKTRKAKAKSTAATAKKTVKRRKVKSLKLK